MEVASPVSSQTITILSIPTELLSDILELATIEQWDWNFKMLGHRLKVFSLVWKRWVAVAQPLLGRQMSIDDEDKAERLLHSPRLGHCRTKKLWIMVGIGRHRLSSRSLLSILGVLEGIRELTLGGFFDTHGRPSIDLGSLVTPALSVSLDIRSCHIKVCATLTQGCTPFSFLQHLTIWHVSCNDTLLLHKILISSNVTSLTIANEEPEDASKLRHSLSPLLPQLVRLNLNIPLSPSDIAMLFEGSKICESDAQTTN